MDEKQVKSKVCGINIDKEIKEETVIFLYKTFGMGAVQELPNSYWVENGLIKSKYIVKYLIEKILKYKSRKQVIQNLSIKTFREAKLTNMMRILYNNNLFKAIDNAYPNQYNEEMFDRTINYWDIDLLKEEGIRDTDAFIALTDSSETNILACLTAKRLGVAKTIAEVENIPFISTAEGLNIGSIINKKLIAKEKDKPVNRLRLREISPHIYGGERVFFRLCGGFSNFLRLYYPEEHWWIPRGTGTSVGKYTQEQEKEAIYYVLVDYLKIDITDETQYYHVTCRDFYSNHLRCLCDKYDYDVKKMINKYYPKLKICMYETNSYKLISPKGETIITNNLKGWVSENRYLFPQNIKDNSIISALMSISTPKPLMKSYRGWQVIKATDLKM